MNVGLLFLMLFLTFCFSLPGILRLVVRGRIYCLFIEDDGYIGGKLKSPVHNNEYIVDLDGAYEIIPDRVGLTTFPRMLPWFFQTTVPCMILRRDVPIPQVIDNPVLKEITAKEVKLGLEPHHLKALVEIAREGGGESRFKKMMPFLMIGGLAVVMIVLFVMFSRIGGLENLLKLVP